MNIVKDLVPDFERRLKSFNCESAPVVNFVPGEGLVAKTITYDNIQSRKDYLNTK